MISQGCPERPGSCSEWLATTSFEVAEEGVNRFDEPGVKDSQQKADQEGPAKGDRQYD